MSAISSRDYERAAKIFASIKDTNVLIPLLMQLVAQLVDFCEYS